MIDLLDRIPDNKRKMILDALSGRYAEMIPSRCRLAEETPLVKEDHPDVDPLEGTPTLKQLLNCVVPEVAPVWYAFGIELEITLNALNCIEEDKRGKVERCCFEMFNYWLSKHKNSGSLPRTWRTILKAVENRCGLQPAEKIEKRICT